MRRVAAGSALLALACAVAVVLTSDGGFDALLAKGAEAVAQVGKISAAVNPVTEEELHWGHKSMKKFGLTPHYWGSNGCDHNFRDLCNEQYYHHHVHPFMQHTKWLDGGERLEEAHKFDEEEEIAFQEATKELHNKVLVEREDWNAEMKELHQEKQDKYEAYFLKLQAEKNQTQEILSAWKTKRDAEVAKIDAAYLEHIGNVSTGREEYKTWYQDALKLDQERKEKFKKMITDMKSAGASTKDIKTATLAFKRQEALFQSQLRGESSSFNEEHEKKEELESKAKQELGQFKALQAKEHARQAGAEHKYEQEQAQERMAANTAASEIMKERQEAAAYQIQAHSYKKDLAKENLSEAKRQDSLEQHIREAKRKEKLHAQKMQEKAVAEVSASEVVHSGVKPTQQIQKMASKATAVTGPAKSVKGGGSAKAVPAKKVAKAAKAQQEAATRQAAFLKALSQQADAEFQALPAEV